MNQASKIGIVGAGLMGTGIAEVCALAGHRTILVKATDGGLDSARARVELSLMRSVEKGRIDAADARAALDRLEVTADRGSLADCELVIESIVEDLAAKRELFAELAELTSSDTILASNTSTLRICDIAATSAADRTIGLHFFSPVPAMKLVEIAHTDSTRPDVMERATGLISGLGKTSVAVVDSTGFVVNRLLVPYLVGAIQAYAQGLASAEEIDTAMKLGCGHPVGPLALSDLIGLDVVYAMAKLLFREFGSDRYRPPALLRRMVQEGHVGKKAKLGFYDYSDGKPRPNAEISALVSGAHLRSAGAA